MAKKTLFGFKSFDNVDISANRTSAATQVEFVDNLGLLVNWSGTSPVGQLIVETSNDWDDKRATGTWTALDFGSTISISGNSGSHTIYINQVPFPWIRVRYARTSGIGSLTVILSTKEV